MGLQIMQSFNGQYNLMIELVNVDGFYNFGALIACKSSDFKF